MSLEARQYALRSYEVYIPTNTSLVERVWGVVLALVLLLAMLGGSYLHSIKALPEPLAKRVEAIRARFIVEQKTPPPSKPKKEPVAKPAEKPVDLTGKPLLAQKQDDATPPTLAPVRRVYGLRRVFAVGLGAQGGAEQAVIGKLGNTLNTEVDTFTATAQDIKGQVVSVTTITTAPSVRKVVKPQYTQEMIDNKVEGVVKVKVLVDVDGRVKKAIPLNDLGFGAADLAVKACFAMEFAPAMRGAEAVAVWIIVPMRFVLLG